MKTSNGAQRAAMAAAVLAVAVLQGCAVMTGVYVPDRAPTNSHSMVSRFDLLRSQSVSSGASASSALHMPRERESGLFYLRY